MSNHINGMDHSKWWIFRAGSGVWYINSPEHHVPCLIYKYSSGAAALEAFAMDRP